MRRPLLGSAERLTLYVPTAMLDEIRLEARRQDRSMSWVVQQAWKLSQAQIQRFPTFSDVLRRVGT